MVFGLIALSLGLRVHHYISNPSLSVDEASLALNLMHRSYWDVLGRLDFQQGAPAGFLLVQKLVISGLGNSPYALRLVPFLAGIAGSLLIYPVASRLVGQRATILAVALFAVSDPLISFAATSKQYSLDVAVILGLYAITLLLPPKTSARGVTVLALSGVAALWFSHPSAFVLAAIGTVLLIELAREGMWQRAAIVGFVCITWLTSFLTAYLLTRSSLEQVQSSVAGSASPFSGNAWQPGVLHRTGAMARSLLGIPAFDHGLRSGITVVAMFLALVCLIVLSRRHRRHAALLLLPALFALAATIFGLYPFFLRTFLFLIPSLVILTAGGAHFLTGANRPTLLRLGTSAAVIVLAGATLYATINHLRSSADNEPVSALRYLAQNARDGDSLYLYLTAQYDFRYYLECGCFAKTQAVRKARALWPIEPAHGHEQFAPAMTSVPPRLIVGTVTGDSAADYRGDFVPLQGRARIWTLIIDAAPKAKHALEAFLGQSGTREVAFPRSMNEPAASLYLYDFRRQP